MLDMTAEQFLLGFRRFVARFGKSKQIISDNGSQFKLAGNIREQIWNCVITDEDVQSYVSNEEIHWHYIVELAPWMGGFYERLVGVVKRGLRKTIGKLNLNIEQLRTIIAECESVVNSRPLVYVGEDINSTISLTPAHFLTLNPRIGIPDTVDEDISDPDYQPQISNAQKLLTSWKKGKRHLDTFWNTMRNEYLLSLRERFATRLKCGRVNYKSEAKHGDVVLIKDQLPRGWWKIGRITKLYEGHDGKIRSCELILPNKKLLNRPLSLLYPIECSVDNNSNDTSDSKENEERKQDNKTSSGNGRPTREAASCANNRIKELSKML